MCGIAGILGPSHHGLLLAHGLAMRKSLEHRGPDDKGLFAGAMGGCSLVLLHARLGIIDLSDAGHQPMSDGRGNRLVFNGEIYNYKELGAPNDAAAILSASARRGRLALPELRGMFAFALWDAERRELFLAVDHAGIKPLYYFLAPDGAFLFASELRALLASGLVPRRICPAGLESFLAMGAVQAPLTMIEGVRALTPGTCLSVSDEGEVTGPVAWWRSPFVREPVAGHAPDAGRIRSLLEDSVRAHMVADVPVGLFLSGGMDSGALAGLVPQGVRSFAVTFPQDRFAGMEAHHAAAAAIRHGLEHTEIALTEDALLAELPAALGAMDQPSFDGLNAYVIAKAVRGAGIKAVLSGLGGDEVFAGYATFRQVPVLAKWGRWLGRGNAADHYIRRKGLFAERERRAMFPDGSGWEGPEMMREMAHGIDPVNAVSLLEQRVYMANMLLRDADAMSMAHGLEVRVPFLDRPLVEYMAGVQGRFKVSRWRHKPLLADAARDILPASAYQRPKQGFVFPWGAWLKGRLRPFARTAILDGEAFIGLGMDHLAVADVWWDFLRGRRRWHHVWSLVALREWASRHVL